MVLVAVGTDSPPWTANVVHTATMVKVFPTEDTAPLVNPGKGWVAYAPFSQITDSAWSVCSVGYNRYNWTDIEPGEGVYNWSIIDNDLQACIDKGKKFGFGVKTGAASNTPNSQVCPEWVFAAGAKYKTISGGTQKIPEWDDPVYIQKKNNFLTALANRYNGNPNIEFVEMRTYGNWGENHFEGIPSAKITFSNWEKLHVDPIMEKFTSTLVYVCSQDDSLNHSIFSDQGSTTLNDAANYVVSKGGAMRWDGAISNFSLNPNPLRANSNLRPGNNEWFANYPNSKTMFGLTNIRKWVPQNITVMRPSYFSLSYWGSDSVSFYNENTTLVNEQLNRLGYHFVLTEASFPDDLANGTTGSITIKVLNKGVDKIYKPAYVKLALLDNSNNVLRTTNLTSINPSSWAPGIMLTYSQNYSFPYTTGASKLAIGLFTNTSLSNPDISFGNNNKTSTKWFILSDMPSSTGSVEYYPSADAYVRGGVYANTNYGSSATLDIKNDSNLDYARKAYLKFNFSDFSGNNISAAKLRVYVYSSGTDPIRTIRCYGTNDESWSETGITWNNAPAAGGYITGTSVSTTASVWQEYDVTSYVKNHINDKIVSFVLEGESSSQGANVSYNSKEATQRKPVLILVP